MRTLVWFRGKDLRVADHEPLLDAAGAGEVVCLFVLDPYFFAPERARELPHRMQFLLESIAALGEAIAKLGSRLLLVEGKSIEVVPRLATAWKVERVVAHRWTEPFGRERDERVAAALRVPFVLYEGETLAKPGTVRTGSGGAFAVFTPFAKAHSASVAIDTPRPPPYGLPAIPGDVRAETVPLPTLASLGIARNPRVIAGGEAAAAARLEAFLKGAAARYETGRDRLDLEGTSRLSADLKFGTLSVRAVWTRARDAIARRHPKAWASFSNELLWREFTHDLLWHKPRLLREPARPEWRAFPWSESEAGWRAWAEGTTGYPVIDAAARQLLGEGFVHNRARMITASFLVKDLGVDYRRGEAHYLKYLVDGDWAQNNCGWQWSAGCGCDAQPFFRVFNPVDQAKRFDVGGAYVRRWVPELAKLPDAYVHAPWTASPIELSAAGVTLGKSYPRPIVDHAAARAKFLAVAKGLKAASEAQRGGRSAARSSSA